MDATRSALIVANYDFQDPGLRRLRAPAHDAESLAEVLGDPEIGGFDVRTVLNQPSHLVDRAIEKFFSGRSVDDLLLLHFSGHGVKDEAGDLYFAAADTDLELLGSTAVSSELVNRLMSRTRARRVVLLLDCCYAGAFERGMATRGDKSMHLAERLGGRGRAIITASTAMEYAFEGKDLADSTTAQPSVFTSALVEGLRSGEADSDQDGLVGLDELYEYVFDRVRSTTPNQTPSKWTLGLQGELVIARRSSPVTRPSPVPEPLTEAIESPFVAVRIGAVQELARMLAGSHQGRALAAGLALERLRQDDSRSVAEAAAAALSANPAPVEVADPGTGPLPAEVPRTDGGSGPQPRREAPPQQDTAPNQDDTTQDTTPTTDGTATTRETTPTTDGTDGTGSTDTGTDGTGNTDTGNTGTGGTGNTGTGGSRWRLPADGRRKAVLLGTGSTLAVVLVVAALAQRGDDPGGADTGPTDPSASVDPSPPPPTLPREAVLVHVTDSRGVGRLRTVVPGSPAEDFDTGTAPAYLPTISPDRSWIVYMTAPDDTAVPRLVRADGTQDRRFFAGDAPCARISRPTWSPDGRELALVCKNDSSELLIARRNGTVMRTISFDEGVPVLSPTWGSDGDRQGIVVAVADQDEKFETTRFQVVAPDGSGSPVDAIEGEGSPSSLDSHPDIGEDGRLLFLRKPPRGDPDGGPDSGVVWIAEPGDTVWEDPQPTGIKGVSSPTWGPDGMIAYLRGDKLYVADPDAPGEERKVKVGGTPGPPAWGSR